MSQADYVLSFPSVTVEANPSPTVVPDELEAAEQDMQEDEVEIFEIEPAAVEKPAELGTSLEANYRFCKIGGYCEL